MTNALDNTDVSDDDWASALAESKTTTVDNAPSTPIEADEAPLIFQKLAKSSTAAFEQVSDIDLILDIPVHLTVQLGSTRIPIKHILRLAQGSVIELDALAGEPMDVLVNGCLIAQGEVVVVNEKFGIRLTDIITPSERVRRINR